MRASRAEESAPLLLRFIMLAAKQRHGNEENVIKLCAHHVSHIPFSLEANGIGGKSRIDLLRIADDKLSIAQMIRPAKRRICTECGEVLRNEHRDYHFTESGLNNVVLRDVEMLVCDKCGIQIPRLPRLNDLMNTIALAIIAKPYKLEAQDVRFLRKFLELSTDRTITPARNSDSVR